MTLKHPLGIPERIDTDRLVIRQYRLKDAEAMHEAVTSRVEELRPWMPWIKFEPQTVDQRRELIRQWELDFKNGGNSNYAIFLHNGTFVGSSGLMTRQGPGILEIGYWAAHEGNGYITEAVIAQTIVGLELPDIDHIEIRVKPENVRSAKVPERAGYTNIGMVEASETEIEFGDDQPKECWVARPGYCPP